MWPFYATVRTRPPLSPRLYLLPTVALLATATALIHTINKREPPSIEPRRMAASIYDRPRFADQRVTAEPRARFLTADVS